MADKKPESKTPPPANADAGDGITTQRVEGTRQKEPTPEELPADAKIAPAAEQIAPNQAAQAVGAIQGENEGKKTLDSDMSDATEFLPEDSKQHDEAERANARAKLRPDEG